MIRLTSREKKGRSSEKTVNLQDLGDGLRADVLSSIHLNRTGKSIASKISVTVELLLSLGKYGLSTVMTASADKSKFSAEIIVEKG